MFSADLPSDWLLCYPLRLQHLQDLVVCLFRKPRCLKLRAQASSTRKRIGKTPTPGQQRLQPQLPRRVFDPLRLNAKYTPRTTVVSRVAADKLCTEKQTTSPLVQWSDRLREIFDGLAAKLGSTSGDWKSFLPMTGLFFMMAFVNTIVNNLSMSLVITAPGGGAGVIPFLTAYVAFPLTLAATVLYTYASHYISRKKLFTITIGLFAAFNLVFAMCLYPNHEILHLPVLADTLSKILPSGFDGAVGMVRNWTFSLFYCLSEMWGDMGITLLFWGFANDITTSEQAPILYPLMGVGANVAQTLGGIALKIFSAGDAATVGGRFQGLLFQVVGCMMVVMALHRYITRKTNDKEVETLKDASMQTKVKSEVQKTTTTTKSKHKPNVGISRRPPQIAQLADSIVGLRSSGFATVSARLKSSREFVTPRGKSMSAQFREPTALDLGKFPLITVPPTPVATPTKELKSHRIEDKKEEKKDKPSFMESIATLRHSTVIKSLGIMTIAQALSVTLMEFVWKSHLKLAYPTPAAFSAFMGDIATSVGLLTGACMLLSPVLFQKIGWTGVARITPVLMALGGCGFFAASSAFHICSQLGMTQIAQSLLPLTVVGGAFLFVLSRSTKFSLFKPSEEMVYINMDKQERMKGKAAVDVVGANIGKSGGSILQQALLLASGGRLLFITPVMFGVYLWMMKGWNQAVSSLSPFQESKKHETEEEEKSEEEAEKPEEETIPLTQEFVPWEEDRETVGSSVVEFNFASDSEDEYTKRIESHPVAV